MEDLIPALEEYYEYTHEGILPFQIEWFPPNYKEAPPRCEGSTFVNGKWCKKNSIDLCIVLFLTDYQDVAPFDETFEAYGGKLEFINHEFSITPKRGTLVVFPANEYFINHTSAVHAGSMYQIRVHLIGSYDTPFIYDPENYKGDYTTWFPR